MAGKDEPIIDSLPDNEQDYPEEIRLPFQVESETPSSEEQENQKSSVDTTMAQLELQEDQPNIADTTTGDQITTQEQPQGILNSRVTRPPRKAPRARST